MIRTSASLAWRSRRDATESTSLCVLSFPCDKSRPSHLEATETASSSVSRTEARRSRDSWLVEEAAKSEMSARWVLRSESLARIEDHLDLKLRRLGMRSRREEMSSGKLRSPSFNGIGGVR